MASDLPCGPAQGIWLLSASLSSTKGNGTCSVDAVGLVKTCQTQELIWEVMTQVKASFLGSKQVVGPSVF